MAVHAITSIDMARTRMLVSRAQRHGEGATNGRTGTEGKQMVYSATWNMSRLPFTLWTSCMRGGATACIETSASCRWKRLLKPGEAAPPRMKTLLRAWHVTARLSVVPLPNVSWENACACQR